MSDFYHLTALDAKKQPVNFDQYKGKVVLVVNVASKCGFTNQYGGLEKVYQQFKDQGLVVLGFPCNQFGHQEPGSDEEIQQFCSMTWSVTFPVLSKVDVNPPEAGKDEHPVYKYLKAAAAPDAAPQPIGWNFEKFLIGKDGKVVGHFNSRVTPEDLAEKIAPLL
ncbi:peroxiredoxin HYR1 [Blastocladiella britannica]|nr:peroxiredoxin HYR1 [Blastocladiella britannica]